MSTEYIFFSLAMEAMAAVRFNEGAGAAGTVALSDAWPSGAATLFSSVSQNN